jgi:CubicO group peptidase (beta-lactamase class C family)
MFDSLAARRKHLLLLALVVSLAGCSAPATSNPVAPIEARIPFQSSATALPAQTQAAADLASEMDAYLNALADDGAFSGSVLVAHHGEILLRQGYGFADRERKIPNTPQTKFRIASLTKQFTAMAILILQAQGQLNVQDHICDYLSECPAPWAAITLHHLLTHTSGIPNLNAFADYRNTVATPSAPVELINHFGDKPLDFQPGESWRYSNSGYMLLGLIIEQAADQSYETFLQESIFAPLKMTATGYDQNHADLAVGYADQFGAADFVDVSNLYAAGGLYATVEDLYRWDQALYTEQLLPQDLCDPLFTPHAVIPDAGWMAYGYGWHIMTEHGRRMFAHGGQMDGFVADIARYPDDETTIIVLSNQYDTRIDMLHSRLAKTVFGDK